MTKHTPGPNADVWHGSHKARIWRAYEHATQDRDRLRETNAELLALVKESLRIAETKTPKWWDSHSVSEVNYYRDARAAIAKAEGSE